MVMNAFHFFGWPVISAGTYDPDPTAADFDVREDSRSPSYYRRLVFRGDYLVGMVAVGDAVDRCGIAVGAIRDRIPLGEAQKTALFDNFRLINLPEVWRRRRLRGEA
jgi:NAD(P)H-nitrite reductase large subunit